MGLTKVTMGLLSGLTAKVLDIMKDHSNINLGEAKAATGTFVDFMIPEGVKRVTVMFDGVSTNGASPIIVQLGDAGGVKNTGYLGGAGIINNSSQTVAQNFTTGFGIAVGIGAYSGTNGALQITLITGNTLVASGSFGRSDNTVAGMCGGSKTISSTLDRIRITTVNGTDQFDAGTVNVSWEF